MHGGDYMKTYLFRLFNLVLVLAMLLTCGPQVAVAKEDAQTKTPPLPFINSQASPGPRQDKDGLWYMTGQGSFSTGPIRLIAPSGTGGPDDFGYTWNDAVPLTWLDASSGTNRTFNAINLGFSFKYYENTYSQIYISQYGYATFDANLDVTQSRLPNPGIPNNVIAPYWAPLHLINGYIRYLTGGTTPNRYFVAEWNRVGSNNSFGTEEFTFEMILYENGDIIFQYQSMTYNGNYWCQVSGIEDSEGIDGLPITSFCNQVAPNHAVRISRPAPAARMKISPLFQSSFSRPGGTATFLIPIRNTGDLGTDTYDLVPGSSSAVSLYASDGTTLLTDTNGNGSIDTGPINVGATITVVAKTQTPISAVVGETQTATVSASSSLLYSSISKFATGFSGDNVLPQQSKTGPTPPSEVIRRDSLKAADGPVDVSSEVTLPVPAYAWRHGCGPTAVGMVVGYYDAKGFADLIPGSAQTQTNAVNQAIASGGDIGSPNQPGQERHFEDYAMPIDYSPNMIQDDYLTRGRPAHNEDSLADFMNTSKSTYNNYYGWSWSSDVGSAFTRYIKKQNPGYDPIYHFYYSASLSWPLLTSEIDAGRPMVFLVDSDGDGSTDHFVPIIGYRTSPTLQYASWDTWSTTTIRWENFTGMASGIPWGIWGGWTFQIAKGKTITLQTAIPAPFAQVYQDSSDGVMNLYLAQPGGQQTRKMTNPGSFGSNPSVAETGNGNFVYAWSKGNCQNSNCNVITFDIEYTLANKFGETVRGVKKLTDNSSATVNTYDETPVMAVAPDGSIGLLWYRELFQFTNNSTQYNYNLFFTILDSSGNTAYGPINLTNNNLWGDSATPDVPQYYNPKISATGDNRFVLAWERYNQIGNCSSNDCSIEDIYYSIRNTSGTQMKGITQFTNDTTGNNYEGYYMPNLTALTGNRALMTWSRSSDGDIYYSVLDSAGNLVKDKTGLMGDGTIITGWNSDAVELSDGKIIVGWTSWGDSYNIRFAVLNTDYLRISGPTLLNNPAAINGNDYVSIASDHSGNAILTWMDYDGNYRRNLYYALVNGSGSILTQPMILRSSRTTMASIQTSFSGSGNTSYSSIPAGVDNAVWPGIPLAGGKPGGSAPIVIQYTSKGQATATGVALTATLGTGLTYKSDTSGVIPVINGNQVTWNLPSIGFLDQHQFILFAGVPGGAAIGARYPVMLMMTANEPDSNPIDNTANLEVMAALQTYLPLTMH
jgi:hypothetical protein